LEGERKLVTVLFADLKGSTELLADRDPEEARKLLDPVLEQMMDAVHRYEGTVNQVMGDGIMALFGAPLAHEDHAVRACYAALRMQESVKSYAEGVRRSHGVEVQIRVGMNSGDVVVRSIGSDLHMDYTAVGQTTHLAARMEQLATPGTIRLTNDTLRLAEGFIEVKPLGAIPVKGLAEPIEVHEAIGVGAVRSRLQAAARHGLTRFVGRDRELEQLRRTRELARNGHGQVATIVGEAGVGKSRLMYEMTRSSRMQGWLILESASVSFGKATSYLPVIDLLKGYFNIQDRNDLREIRDKVIGKVLSLDESLKSVLPAILALLDVPVEDPAWRALDPGQRRQRTLDSIKGLLMRETHKQPVLLVLEDLHWIDGATQALLDALVEGLASQRLLLLATYRPEYQHTWSGKTYYIQTRLDALPPDSTDQMLDALLGDDVTLAPLKKLLVRRGNPFFLEETVRTMVETGVLAGERGQYRMIQPVNALQVPTTVQTVLAARIDRLPPDDKELLQIAAVIGKDVPFPLLLAVANMDEDTVRRGLAALQAAEFLYETRLFPDLEYTFKHALTHEVTYRGLLHDRQRTLHARTVDAIETLYADRLQEHIEKLAQHAARGGLKEKAVDYFRQAGRKSAARSALLESRTWFEQALGVLETLPQSSSTLAQAFDIRLELRPALAQLGEIAAMVDRVREAESLAEQLNDDPRRGRACAFMMSAHQYRGNPDDSLATGARALEIAGRLGDLRLRILVTTFSEVAHYDRGDYQRCIELATENLAALPAEWTYEYFGNIQPSSTYDRFCLYMSLAHLGRFVEASKYEAEARRLIEPLAHAAPIGWYYFGAGSLSLIRGEWAKARSLLAHALVVLRVGDVTLMLARTVSSLAPVVAQLGDTNEALNLLREGEGLFDRQAAQGIVNFHGWHFQLLGRTNLLLGRLNDARRLGDRAVASSPRQLGFAAYALHLLGDIATHPDRFDAERGEANYRQALALAEPRGMRPVIAHCHLGLGKLYRRTDKREQAQKYLMIATTMYREMGMTYWLEKAEKELASSREANP
jgi:class 3 adenylate cyclase/tetratricopeptide (TPR) repeat protein